MVAEQLITTYVGKLDMLKIQFSFPWLLLQGQYHYLFKVYYLLCQQQ